MTRKLLIFGIIYLTSILMSVIVMFGQNNNNNQPPQKPELVERFEKVIKKKETKYTAGKIRFGERIGKLIASTLEWKLNEDRVTLYLKEFETEQEARDFYDKDLHAPLAVYVATTKLTNLGDEAFFQTNGEIIKSTSLIARKGKVVLHIKSNDLIVAKRFAQHFVQEIEKRDKEQNNIFQSRNSPLVERFEKAIKNKEKRFTQHNLTKTTRDRNWQISGIVWRFGEAGVQCEILEFDSELEAIKYLYRGYINSPKDVSSDGRLKLTNLGDEAYITPNLKNKDSKDVSMLVRKGSVFILIYASDQILGKRFAKHFVREIEKRDRGEQ